MYNHTTSTIYTKPKYITRNVGGKNNNIQEENIKEQINIIENNNNKLLSKDKINNNNKLKDLYFNNYKRYDPYVEYLNDKGLIDKDNTNKRRYKKNYIDIYSKYRMKEPTTIKDESYILNNNPIKFVLNSNVLEITHKNHNYKTGDLISLNGIRPKEYILRTKNNLNKPSFIIPPNGNFMKIFYKHDLILENYNNDCYIELEGIKGDRGTNNLTSYLGNIPINLINTTHKIILELTVDDIPADCDLSNYPSDILDYNDNSFFIKLPKSMHNPLNEPAYLLKEYNYKIKFLNIAGIPLNLLNADYPINSERLNGFHKIIDYSTNTYKIQINAFAIKTINDGGNNIIISKIQEIKIGYPNSNNYIIDIGKTYNNIISARLISMEFPNAEQVINNNIGKQNNKIYWNNIDDGDVLYNIEVPPGNYTPDTLSTRLEELFFNTERIITSETLGRTYTKNHYVQVSINTNTDLVSFSMYKEYILNEPFVNVSPEIYLNTNFDNNPDDTQYTITIYHPGHNFINSGQKILISNAIENLGIPASIFNTEHVVHEIIDDNYYTIILPKFNLSNTRNLTKGGVSVKIYVPDLFRLRFDLQDTMGYLLGFRNPGNQNSITNYASVITNNDKYILENDINSFGQPISLSNNSIQLSGHNYVLMVINPLNTIKSITPVKDIFAKIQLCDLPGKFLFNSNIDTINEYDNPINNLSNLEIQFYTPDGDLFDFNGIDHSFTLELITINEIPKMTNINVSINPSN